MSTYAQLVERGCLCGGDTPAQCPVHKPGDNRGLRAFFEAGMPRAFPMEANCAICKADSLLYPNIELDKAHRSGGDAAFAHRRTLICPLCSKPGIERALVAEVEATGLHELNSRRVFYAEAVAA